MTKKSPQHHRKHRLVWIGGGILVLIVVGTALELTNTINILHSKSAGQYVTAPLAPGRTVNENTKGETPATDDQSSPSDDKEQTYVNPNTPLTDPVGPFVSNHHPNLDGSPAPNSLESVCTTTSGATCEIVFTKGSVSKTLPSQQTDKGGSAYWSWSLQDLGLSEGTWEVRATATLGSQTKSSTDPLKLEVAP